MFSRPHPDVPLSTFALVQLINTYAFADALQHLRTLQQRYARAKARGQSGEAQLISMLAGQRNTWITGCGLGAWLLLYRFRALLAKQLNTPVLAASVESAASTRRRADDMNGPPATPGTHQEVRGVPTVRR